MKGWKRSMTWDETGLEWIVASPHVPQGKSAVFYSVTGIFGEFGYVNIGVGYTLPFEIMGAPWINADRTPGFPGKSSVIAKEIPPKTVFFRFGAIPLS